MAEWLTDKFEWLKEHDALLGWLFGISLLTFIASLVAVPWLISRIPADYYLKKHPKTDEFRERHVLLRVAFIVMKNLLGFVLILAGIAMLVLPGQGLLTLLIGVFLMDFPGKDRLELAIIRKQPVYRAVNWIRSKAGRDPLLLPSTDEQTKLDQQDG